MNPQGNKLNLLLLLLPILILFIFYSKSTAQTGLYALGWSCLVFINTQSKSCEENNETGMDNKDLMFLIEYQSKLLQIVLSAGLAKLNDIINTMVSEIYYGRDINLKSKFKNAFILCYSFPRCILQLKIV